MKNCVMAVALACLTATAATAADDKKDEPKASKLTGKLQTGVVAIGGETTGIVLHSRGGSYELDFGKNKELREKAEKLNGKNVTVTGSLTIRKGVEVKERRIVAVTAIQEADAEK
jgi:hypothetical protein